MTGSLPEPLAGLLDRATRDGRTVAIWWRDDDAVADTPALDRLLGLAADHAAPVAIAAIPEGIEPSLQRRLDREPLAAVLIHGLGHADHAAIGEKPAEFGDHRPLAAMADEVRRARSLIRAAFGERALDMFVPPWNRLSPRLTSILPDLGIVALSAFGQMSGDVRPDLTILNAHVDPVDWRRGRSLVSPDRLATSLRALAAPDHVSATAPIGLLSHHLAFDEALWDFWARLLGDLAGHPAVRLVPVSSLLPPPSASSTCTSQVALGYGGRQGERFT